MSKLLIIDKSVFHKSVLHDNFTEQLIKFVQSHQVVLPNTLGVECIISDDEGGKELLKNPSKLLEKLGILVRNGAYISRSVGAILKQERETKKAIDCIIDYQGTKMAREKKANLDSIFIKSEAEKVKKEYQTVIDYCKTLATTWYGNLVKRNMQKSFRQECNQTNFKNRLKNWIQATDKLREQILNNQLPSLSSYITDKNDKWLNWQLLRIYFAWAIEWASRRNQSGPSFQGDIEENDVYDMEYISYLNNADGILSEDKKLVLPLAKAAFPDKGVFESLDEVPDEYVCHWS